MFLLHQLDIQIRSLLDAGVPTNRSLRSRANFRNRVPLIYILEMVHRLFRISQRVRRVMTSAKALDCG